MFKSWMLKNRTETQPIRGDVALLNRIPIQVSVLKQAWLASSTASTVTSLGDKHLLYTYYGLLFNIRALVRFI